MSFFEALVKGGPRDIGRRIISILTFIIGQICFYWVYEKTGRVVLFLDLIFQFDASMKTLMHVSTGLGIFGLIVIEVNYSKMEDDYDADAYLKILRFIYNTLSLLFPFGAGMVYGWIGIFCIGYWILSMFFDCGEAYLLLGAVTVFALAGYAMSFEMEFSSTLTVLVETWGLEESSFIEGFPKIAGAIGVIGGIILWKWTESLVDDFSIDESDRGVFILFFGVFSLLGGIYFMAAYILLGLIFCLIGKTSEEGAHVYLIVMLIVLGVALVALYGTACYYRYDEFGWKDFAWYELLQELKLIKG